jgi:UDP-N-acetyl-D-mannosaminuronate dehydrogenase
MRRALHLLVVLISGFLLFGCATSIMKGYIGQPISTVIGDYGFPAGAYDLDQNRRAFVWQKNVMIAVPGSSTTTASVVGNTMFAQTYSTPGMVGSSSCNYTLIAQRTRSDIEGPAAWTVVDFQKPRFMCE